MAKRVEEVTLGFDVSKRELEVLGNDAADTRVIKNDPATIAQFLDRFGGPVVMAVESTNVYHEQLVDLALERGLRSI